MIQTSVTDTELLEEVIPKLKNIELFLHDTLRVKIDGCRVPKEIHRLRNLKSEFELEISMIRMNLSHLLRRYSDQLIRTVEDAKRERGTQIVLDEHEAVAIERIRRLYQRSQEVQTDPA
ncbi:hypothetical protein [Billgrantia antri]|uniref:Uncharacterized protein n=1 Tax=Billgrantia antri TaxID=2846777 RepID=A0ABS6ZMX4_9GAMM|nr:hypothetical protein [Halomonas antri]MBW6391405.1 hypothetical protein [Halomonas antri]